MTGWSLVKSWLKPDPAADLEYLGCIRDLADHEMVRSMKNYPQHGGVDCLEHSLYVSYSSYLVCRKLGLDGRAAARGGLLHDFFLYDWHAGRPGRELHGFAHPRIALRNANRYFHLSEREQDIIDKHMWPLTVALPKYREAYVVAAADKYCAVMETFRFGKRAGVRRLQSLLCW